MRLGIAALALALSISGAGCSSSDTVSSAVDSPENPSSSEQAADASANNTAAGTSETSSSPQSVANGDSVDPEEVPDDSAAAPPRTAAFAEQTDGKAVTTTVDPSCPVQPGATTASTLNELATAIDNDNNADLASELDALASAFSDGEPAPEDLVGAVTALPLITSWLTETASAECASTVKATLGRIVGLSGVDDKQLADSAQEAAKENFPALIERNYDLSSSDAACVAAELEEAGVDTMELDDVSFLVALSTCANER